MKKLPPLVLIFLAFIVIVIFFIFPFFYGEHTKASLEAAYNNNGSSCSPDASYPLVTGTFRQVPFIYGNLSDCAADGQTIYSDKISFGNPPSSKALILVSSADTGLEMQRVFVHEYCHVATFLSGGKVGNFLEELKCGLVEYNPLEYGSFSSDFVVTFNGTLGSGA